MKQYLTENWSTVLLIAVILAMMGSITFMSRGWGDPLAYVGLIIPVGLLAAGIYGRVEGRKIKAGEGSTDSSL